MTKYIKNPIAIEAYQHTGSSTSVSRLKHWVNAGIAPISGGVETCDIVSFELETNHGFARVSAGDWVIKTEAGEFYPCSNAEFQKNYSKAPSDYIERMQSEYAELNTRVESLRAFFYNPLYKRCSQHKKNKLKAQLQHMEQYLMVLGHRIELERFGEVTEPVNEVAEVPEQQIPDSLFFKPLIKNQTFSGALSALKDGHAIQRAGWNGNNLFVYMVPAAAYPAQTGIAKAYFGEGAKVPYGAYMAIKGGDNRVNTWVPSVSDCLAEDWIILEQPQ